MKKLFLILFILSFALPAYASTISWDSLDGAKGYIIFYSDANNNWSKDVGNLTSYELDGGLNLDPGVEYNISVAPYNAVGVGIKSTPVKYTRPAYIAADNPKTTVIDVPDGKVIITINITKP